MFFWARLWKWMANMNSCNLLHLSRRACFWHWLIQSVMWPPGMTTFPSLMRRLPCPSMVILLVFEQTVANAFPSFVKGKPHLSRENHNIWQTKITGNRHPAVSSRTISTATLTVSRGLLTFRMVLAGCTLSPLSWNWMHHNKNSRTLKLSTL